jgi:hypothetical protein
MPAPEEQSRRPTSLFLRALEMLLNLLDSFVP